MIFERSVRVKKHQQSGNPKVLVTDRVGARDAYESKKRPGKRLEAERIGCCQLGACTDQTCRVR